MDKKKSIKKLNNAGSTMLVMVIAVAFVGILCSLVFSITMTNIKMKTVDRQSKSNFYSVEQALDEIVVAVEELTATKAKDAYQYTLERYVVETDPDKLLEKFQQKTVELIKTELEGSDPVISTAHIASWLGSKIRVTAGNANVFLKNDAGQDISLEVDPDGKYVAIRNLKVSYKENGFETAIQTDIRIDMPDTTMIAVSGNKNIGLPFNEYSLIGNKSIEISNTAALFYGVGSMFGGTDGITFENLNASILAKNIVSLGDIKFTTGSNIDISNNSMTLANIWADNVETALGSSSGTDVKLRFESNFYVKDDLNINAPNSNVVLKNSSTLTGDAKKCEYVGFSNGIGGGEAADNSAIVINGINSKLDLSGINSVSVAGKSFIMKDSESNDEISTGESITTKGNQIAYLVPDECITIDGVKAQNPAIVEIVGGSYVTNISINTNKKINGVDLSLYLEDAGVGKGYKRRLYPIAGSSSKYMAYYYLTGFKTDAVYNIESYARAYANANSEKIESVFPIQGISVGSGSKLTTAGNYTIYDSTASKGKKEEIKEKSTGVATDFADAERKYNAMVKFLEIPSGGLSGTDEDNWLANKIASNSSDAFDNIIKLSDINALSSSEVISRTETVNGANVTINNCVAFNVTPYPAIIVRDTSFNVPSNIKEGLIVCTGDVVLNHSFTGLILAKGKITVSGASCSNVKADAIKISEIFLAANDNINKYFVDTKISNLSVGTGSVADGSTSSIDISDLISFENWRKN